jgi:hypothetical protein
VAGTPSEAPRGGAPTGEDSTVETPRFLQAVALTHRAMEGVGYCDLGEINEAAQTFDFVLSGAIKGDPLSTKEKSAARLETLLNNFDGPPNLKSIYEELYRQDIERFKRREQEEI